MKRRFLSCMLVLTMLCAFVPTVANAATPTLTMGTITRTSDPKATVLFTPSVAGTYHYAVVEPGVTPTSYFTATCDATEQTLRLLGMTEGEKQLYFYLEDTGGNKSAVQVLSVPAYLPMRTIYFSMNDSGGDGWNGSNFLLVFENGDPSIEVTLESGSSGSRSLAFPRNTKIDIYWIQAAKSWECSASICYDGVGTGGPMILYNVPSTSKLAASITIPLRPPSLFDVRPTRLSDTEADITFTPLVAGIYHYAVVDEGQTPTTFLSEPCSAEPQTLHLTNLTPGKKYVYLYLEDDGGNTSSQNSYFWLQEYVPPRATVSPSSQVYDLSTETEGFSTQLTLNGNTLTGITNEGTNTELRLGIDYTLEDTTLTFLPAYLHALSSASYRLRLDFAPGNPYSFMLYIVRSKPMISGELVSYASEALQSYQLARSNLAMRLTPSDLDALSGRLLKQVQFVPGSGVTGMTLQVWTGGTVAGSTCVPGTLVHSQPIESWTEGVWNTVSLTTPLVVDASQDLWIGFACTGTSATFYYSPCLTTARKGAIFPNGDHLNNTYENALCIRAVMGDTPTLTPGHAVRMTDALGAVQFSVDTTGEYYVKPVSAGAPAPIIDTSGSGTPCTAGLQTVGCADLTAGEQDVYVVVKTNGRVSAPLCIRLPAPPAYAPGLLYEQVFSGSVLPDGWTADAGWTMHPTDDSISSLVAESWLISPPLMLPENAIVEYDWMYSNAYNSEFGVYISTTGTDHADFQPLSPNTPTTISRGDWVCSAKRLSAYTGPVYLAFVNKSTNSASIRLHRFAIRTWESAPAPVATLEAVDRLSHTSATVRLGATQKCGYDYCLTAPGVAPPDWWGTAGYFAERTNTADKAYLELDSLQPGAYDLYLVFENAIGKRCTTRVSIPAYSSPLPYLTGIGTAFDPWRNPSDVIIEMVPHNETLTTLYGSNSTDPLVLGRDYTVNGNFVSIKNSFLDTLGNRTLGLRFIFSDSTMVRYSIGVTSTKPSFSDGRIGYITGSGSSRNQQLPKDKDNTFAIRFSPQDLAELGSDVLRQVQFAPEFSCACSLKIWQGGSYDNGVFTPGTLVATQRIDRVTPGQINTITLDTPLNIDPTRELWIGVQVDQNTNIYSVNMVADSYHFSLTWGNLICTDGVWSADGYYTLFMRGIFDGVVPSTLAGAQVRTRGNWGLRFLSELPLERSDVEEFGTILVPYTDALTLDTFVIGASSVVKVPAKRFYAKTDTKVQFTAVLTDIAPEHYARRYSARAYAILKDGSVVYADDYTTRSLYEVAQAALQDTNATWSESERAYLQKIVTP